MSDLAEAYQQGRRDALADMASILVTHQQCGESRLAANPHDEVGFGYRAAALHIGKEIAELPDPEVGERLDLIRRAHDMKSQKANLGGEC